MPEPERKPEKDISTEASSSSTQTSPTESITSTNTTQAVALNSFTTPSTASTLTPISTSTDPYSAASSTTSSTSTLTSSSFTDAGNTSWIKVEPPSPTDDAPNTDPTSPALKSSSAVTEPTSVKIKTPETVTFTALPPTSQPTSKTTIPYKSSSETPLTTSKAQSKAKPSLPTKLTESLPTKSQGSPNTNSSIMTTTNLGSTTANPLSDFQTKTKLSKGDTDEDDATEAVLDPKATEAVEATEITVFNETHVQITFSSVEPITDSPTDVNSHVSSAEAATTPAQETEAPATKIVTDDVLTKNSSPLPSSVEPEATSSGFSSEDSQEPIFSSPRPEESLAGASAKILFPHASTLHTAVTMVVPETSAKTSTSFEASSINIAFIRTSSKQTFKPSSTTLRQCFKTASTTTVTWTFPATTTTEKPSTNLPTTVTTTIPTTTKTTTTETPTTTSSKRSCFKDRSDISTTSKTPTTKASTTDSTTTKEIFTTTEATCATPCEGNWKEGESACYQLIFIEAPNYENATLACSKEGQSMPSVLDFDIRTNYELFRRMTLPHPWVLTDPEPTREYRMTRKIKAINVTRSFFLDREVKLVADKEVVENMAVICKKPKFCLTPKCNFSDYFRHPAAERLIRYEDTELFNIGEVTEVKCNSTDPNFEKVEISCRAKGYFTPYADSFICISEENEIRQKREAKRQEMIAAWYTGEPIRNCRDCLPDGTKSCSKNVNGTFKCECKEGWIGTKCDKSPDFCAEGGLCKNGGVCKNYVTEFYCECNGNMKEEDCSLNVEKLDFNNPKVKAAFVPVSFMFAFLAIAGFLLCIANLATDCSHPQSFTQCLKHGFLCAVCVMSALFRHPDIVGLDPFAGCRFYNWLIYMMWIMGLSCWLMEAHLCWGVMSNNFMNVWEDANKWHLFKHLRVIPIIVPGLLIASLGHGFFWDEIRHSWSCTGTMHPDGKNFLIFISGVCVAMILKAIGFAQMAKTFKHKDWFRYVRMYRSSIDDPHDYGRHMEVAEKNVNFTLVGPIIYSLLWVLAVAANDLYNPSISTLFCLCGWFYFCVLVCQLCQTNRVILSYIKTALMLYGPYRWAPNWNYNTLFSCDETIAKYQPERMKKLEDWIEQRRLRWKEEERQEIERKNEERRRLFAEGTGQPGEACSQALLYHVPEEGPPLTYPELFYYKPSDSGYIPEIQRFHFNARFRTEYLKCRLDPELTPMEALSRVNYEHYPKIVGTPDRVNLHLWKLFCRNVLRSESDHLSKDKIKAYLKVDHKKNLKKRRGAFTIENTPMGPKEKLLLKDLDALLPCQVITYMEALNKDMARINEPFDKIYEDDLNIPLYVDVVERVPVENVDNESRDKLQ
ncbi:hypothetical protein L596_020168 [Steinernema carpocapsae]|uniref:EGF-like domain-containing protein n=1 Tax=Steinernema carpocapsae TaxID=34508 RepID=A0A4U5MSU8_STECR|nr:hypothetical protein L596_020168 [Steinernema carpocapsae]